MAHIDSTHEPIAGGGEPVAGGEPKVSYPSGKSREQIEFEQGRIDYTGRHRFEFIQQALDTHLDDSSDSV